MPFSESTKASFAMMWIMVIGVVICVIMKSPWALAFGFALLWCFFGMVKQLTESKKREEDGVDGVAMEMQPLGKIRADMTLGELLEKY